MVICRFGVRMIRMIMELFREMRKIKGKGE